MDRVIKYIYTSMLQPHGKIEDINNIIELIESDLEIVSYIAPQPDVKHIEDALAFIYRYRCTNG